MLLMSAQALQPMPKPPLRPNACLQVRSRAHGQRVPDWRGRVHVIAASDPVLFAFDKYIEDKSFLRHSVYCVPSAAYMLQPNLIVCAKTEL
jgi:hypothetical protein